MKKVLFVTGSRADYGIVRRLLKKLDADSDVELLIVATAMHLEEKYGYTYRDIENDGFSIFRKIPMHLINTKTETIVQGIATLSVTLADIFKAEHIDLTMILGDRYEMLAVADTAVLYKVPICHLHGGEQTLGNYDDLIRHSITKMSQLHLTSTERYRQRVIQMGEIPNRVINTGSLGVENVLTESMPSFQKLMHDLGLQLLHPGHYYVCLFHPTTLEPLETNVAVASRILSAIGEAPCIFIGSNSDTGSDAIMSLFLKDVESHSNHFLFKSMSTKQYHALVKNSLGLIGNSSSGIIEVPSLKVPTLNIGSRQGGRDRGPSVIDISGSSVESVQKGLKTMRTIKAFKNPYERPGASETAYEAIKMFLNSNTSSKKYFFDIDFALSGEMK